MTDKKLRDYFTKYTPVNKGESDIFDRACNVLIKADKGKKMYEISFSYPEVIKYKSIEQLENNIKDFYGIESIKLYPSYPSEIFGDDCLPEIIEEAKRTGIAANGYLKEYNAEIINGILSVSIPFEHSASVMVELANLERLISDIVLKRFSVSVDTVITCTKETESIESYLERRHDRDADAFETYVKSFAHETDTGGDKGSVSGKETLNLKRTVSLFDCPKKAEVLNNGEIKCGRTLFNVSDPEVLFGKNFDIIDPVPLRAVTGERESLTVLGEVFSFVEHESRSGERVNLTIGITDRDSSVYVRKTVGSDKLGEWKDKIRIGACVAVRGRVLEDKFDDEYYVAPNDVLKIKRVKRADTASEKRVELHLHTNMSEADALIKPDEAVMTAYNWGHPAVAITDHGNLQSFPIAMLTLNDIQKNEDHRDFKVIYGIEDYFVDDTERAVYGDFKADFGEEFISFDIETTGFSSQNDRIIEIGAVRIKNGEILEKYDTFVDPEIDIPERITELTGITNEMVRGQRKIEEVLPEFLNFVGDRLLIAHNASFDTSFIRRAAERTKLQFNNPYLDTVAMSRYVNPDLSKHKLDVLAKYYDLGDFNHHRACDDAEMLALIFFKMIDKLREEGVTNFGTMSEYMSERSDPLKLKPFHQIILVKNLTGLRNLYILVSDSYLKYFRRYPRFPKSHVEEYRDGLLIGSACEAGELYQAILRGLSDSEIEEIASFYDYLEIQPISNNEFLISSGSVSGIDELININKKIYDLGKKLGKLVVATSDAHYMDPEDEIYRRILLTGKKYPDADRETKLYFKTTDEMLAEFAYLGEEAAREVVIENPKKICDMIEPILPIPKGKYDPHIDGSDDELRNKCYSMAHELYGDPLPEEVSSRLDKELNSIIDNGYSVMYIIAKKLVENSEEKGYQVGSRGSVGSSLAAYMGGITKVNALPPHYRCPSCKYSDFETGKVYGSGFDMPAKNCPICGAELIRDGHDIPFETFLGFKGDKVPDIDLNFSGDVQSDAHKFTEVLFGAGHAFRAGTIGTLADKTAYGLTVKYLEEKGIMLPKAEIDRLMTGCVGTKRTTGQHPGGIIVVPREYEIYDFTPVQHPAGDQSVITTHFEFKYLHDTILKLDILGHDIPTKYKRIEEYTGTNILDTPLTDPRVYKLFTSPEPLGVTPEQLKGVETGTLCLPEMNTPFVRGVLIKSQPKTFADLLQISGLTHGTAVWLGNAEDLIENKICTISDVIGTRDDIMLCLIHKYGLEKSLAFKIMEKVRKGKGLDPEQEAEMRNKGVPDWYIDSCKKIKYMFPKAHAAAYVIDALRMGWHKIYNPVEFYSAYFSAAPGGCDAGIVLKGKNYVFNILDDLSKIKNEKDATQKDKEQFNAIQIVNECYQRGIEFLPVSVKKSHATKFVPEDGKIRMPFISLAGLGESAAENIMLARDEGRIHCIEDLKTEAKIGNTLIELLKNNGALEGMNPTNQMSLFDLFS